LSFSFSLLSLAIIPGCLKGQAAGYGRVSRATLAPSFYDQSNACDQNLTINIKKPVKNHKSTLNITQHFSLYYLVIFYFGSFNFNHLAHSHGRSRWFNPSTAYHEIKGLCFLS